MELRYGREVTLADVEREVEGLSRAQRKANLVEGIAMEGRGARLPGPIREAAGASRALSNRLDDSPTHTHARKHKQVCSLAFCQRTQCMRKEPHSHTHTEMRLTAFSLSLSLPKRQAFCVSRTGREGNGHTSISKSV